MYPAVAPTLFDVLDPGIDRDFGDAERLVLDHSSWIEHVPGWLRGSHAVFEHLLETLPWRQRCDVVMYDRRVDEPRLTSWWRASDPTDDLPPVLLGARSVLSARFDCEFDSVGFNLYRDGRDSVAWHGDRHRHHVVDPVVAIVSVGARRTFRLRPRGGGASHTWGLGHGDLLVMGGACQHDWQHAVPKVARAIGARISITYRHGAADITATATLR